MTTQRPYRGIHNGGWKKGFLSYNFKTNEYEIVNSQGTWAVIESSVSQSTGRKDKHGVEIYGGMKIKDQYDEAMVYWNKDRAGFYCLWGDSSDMPLDCGVAISKCEIIPEGEQT